MTREELYDLVWKEPVTKVAKRFGISDVALRKTCIRHDIPTPPLGYWAKLAHGKPVKRPPLPKAAQYSDHISLTLKEPEPAHAAVSEALSAAAAREMTLAPVQALEERPETIHAITLATEKELSKSKPDHENFVHAKHGGSVSVSVGVESRPRAILFVEAFIRACSVRDCSTELSEEGVRVYSDGQRFELRVYETKAKSPYVLTASDIRRQAQYDADSKRLPSLYPPRKVTPTWTYAPSGRLCFEISDPSRYSWNAENIVGRWYDRANRQVETFIGDAIVAVAGAAARNKIRDAEIKERERIRAEREEERRREAEERARAKREADYLLRKAEHLTQLEKLMALSAHIRGASCLQNNETTQTLLAKLNMLIEQLREALSPDLMSAELETGPILNE